MLVSCRSLAPVTSDRLVFPLIPHPPGLEELNSDQPLLLDGISENPGVGCCLDNRTEIRPKLTLFPRCEEQCLRRENDLVTL